MLDKKALRTQVEKIKNDWCAANLSNEALVKYVHTLLEKQREEVLFATLGLKRDSWHPHKLETVERGLIHSALGPRIQQLTLAFINAELEAILTSELRQQLVDAMKRDFEQQFKSKAWKRIEESVEKCLDFEVKKMLDDISPGLADSEDS